MKAEFSISFADELRASNALKVLLASARPAKQKAKDDEEAEEAGAERAEIAYSQKGATINAVVTARDFTALRARSTSFLRDVRVIVDAQAVASSK